MAHQPVTVTNNTIGPINICKFVVPANASADNTATLYPVLTKVASVPPGPQPTVYTPTESLEYLVFVGGDGPATGLPYSAVTTQILKPTTVTVSPDDLTKTTAA